jgi:hypothetical protein
MHVSCLGFVVEAFMTIIREQLYEMTRLLYILEWTRVTRSTITPCS